MHQRDVALGVVVQQFLPAQPVEQIVAIRRVDDFAQRVVLLQALDVVGRGQQVQVMGAQHRGDRVAHGVEEAQRAQRIRTAVDQVADQPQVVPARLEIHALKQAFERLQAALDVADGIQGHQCNAPGTARRKGGMGASKRVPSSASIW